MLKRVILALTAVAAGPLAVLAAPAVAHAADCVIGLAYDNSYDGDTLITRTVSGSTVGARIEQSWGQLKFITQGSTYHYMQGYVQCQDNGPFDNQWTSWTTQKSAGNSVTIACPSGYTGVAATAYLHDSNHGTCPTVPNPG